MWIRKLEHIQGVVVEIIARGDLEPTVPLPAHSAGFFKSLILRDVRWHAADGTDAFGSLRLGRRAWIQGDDRYGFPPDVRAMLCDLHNDHAAAYFVHHADASIDTADIRVAAPGQEARAVRVAETL